MYMLYFAYPFLTQWNYFYVPVPVNNAVKNINMQISLCKGLLPLFLIRSFTHKVFNFGEVQFIYFFSCCLCLECHIQEISAKFNVM